MTHIQIIISILIQRLGWIKILTIWWVLRSTPMEFPNNCLRFSKIANLPQFQTKFKRCTSESTKQVIIQKWALLLLKTLIIRIIITLTTNLIKSSFFNHLQPPSIKINKPSFYFPLKLETRNKECPILIKKLVECLWGLSHSPQTRWAPSSRSRKGQKLETKPSNLKMTAKMGLCWKNRMKIMKWDNL